jgi:glyoxylase-like metal-dependent hydrolase (beta-lactamase superfamily II)
MVISKIYAQRIFNFERRKMKIGKYNVHALECERFALDGGAMFGTVPKVLWEKTNPPDDKNRIEMSARAMLLVSDDKKILVDTGMGQKWQDKQRGMFKISESFLETNLKHFGLTPDDITDVILTHLHFDHAGGATKPDANGKLVAAFPNATYYVQEENYKWAINPNPREKASYLKENFIPLVEAGKLKFVNGETELFEGVSPYLSNAHTKGQQLVKVTGGGQTLIYCCDLIPMAAHLPIPYTMGYDLFPLDIMAEKKKLLEQAEAENWTLFFEHDPFIHACTVQAGEKGIVQKESVVLN